MSSAHDVGGYDTVIITQGHGDTRRYWRVCDTCGHIDETTEADYLRTISQDGEYYYCDGCR